jgi:hypothetical protein
VTITDPVSGVRALPDVSTGNQRVLLHRAQATIRSTLGSGADAVDLADLVPA